MPAYNQTSQPFEAVRNMLDTNISIVTLKNVTVGGAAGVIHPANTLMSLTSGSYVPVVAATVPAEVRGILLYPVEQGANRTVTMMTRAGTAEWSKLTPFAGVAPTPAQILAFKAQLEPSLLVFVD